MSFGKVPGVESKTNLSSAKRGDKLSRRARQRTAFVISGGYSEFSALPIHVSSTDKKLLPDTKRQTANAERRTPSLRGIGRYAVVGAPLRLAQHFERGWTRDQA